MPESHEVEFSTVRRHLVKNLLIVSGIIMVVGAAWLMYYLSGRGPSTLTVHLEDPWTQITISAPDIGTRRFTPGSLPLSVSNIGYGDCIVRIQFQDGKTLQLVCFHCDSGMSKTLAFTIKRDAIHQASIHATCTYRDEPPCWSHTETIDLNSLNPGTYYYGARHSSLDSSCSPLRSEKARH